MLRKGVMSWGPCTQAGGQWGLYLGLRALGTALREHTEIASWPSQQQHWLQTRGGGPGSPGGNGVNV